MKVELAKLDYGHGSVGLLVHSMVGDTSLKFTPEDEGVVGVTTRISPSSKKLLEQFSEIGGVSQSIITRICIESGLRNISELLTSVKEAKEQHEEQEQLRYSEMAEYDEEKEVAAAVKTLAELRKKGGRK